MCAGKLATHHSATRQSAEATSMKQVSWRAIQRWFKNYVLMKSWQGMAPCKACNSKTGHNIYLYTFICHDEIHTSRLATLASQFSTPKDGPTLTWLDVSCVLFEKTINYRDWKLETMSLQSAIVNVLAKTYGPILYIDATLCGLRSCVRHIWWGRSTRNGKKEWHITGKISLSTLYYYYYYYYFSS